MSNPLQKEKLISSKTCNHYYNLKIDDINKDRFTKINIFT